MLISFFFFYEPEKYNLPLEYIIKGGRHMTRTMISRGLLKHIFNMYIIKIILNRKMLTFLPKKHFYKEKCKC